MQDLRGRCAQQPDACQASASSSFLYFTAFVQSDLWDRFLPFAVHICAQMFEDLVLASHLALRGVPTEVLGTTTGTRLPDSRATEPGPALHAPFSPCREIRP